MLLHKGLTRVQSQKAQVAFWREFRFEDGEVVGALFLTDFSKFDFLIVSAGGSGVQHVKDKQFIQLSGSIFCGACPSPKRFVPWLPDK